MDPVGNAITWVFGSVRGLPKPWVLRTLMLEEGTLGCLRSDVIHSGGGTKGVRKAYERVTMCTKGCTKGYTKGGVS